MNTRPISVSHVVFGLIFLGITAMWVIGETTDINAPAFAVWGPVVLIGAGVVGLIVTLTNSRRKDTRPEAEHELAETHLDETHLAETRTTDPIDITQEQS
jgi:uncharacterized membrane protein YqjE